MALLAPSQAPARRVGAYWPAPNAASTSGLGYGPYRPRMIGYGSPPSTRNDVPLVDCPAFSTYGASGLTTVIDVPGSAPAIMRVTSSCRTWHRSGGMGPATFLRPLRSGLSPWYSTRATFASTTYFALGRRSSTGSGGSAEGRSAARTGPGEGDGVAKAKSGAFLHAALRAPTSSVSALLPPHASASATMSAAAAARARTCRMLE